MHATAAVGLVIPLSWVRKNAGPRKPIYEWGWWGLFKWWFLVVVKWRFGDGLVVALHLVKL